MSTNTSVKSNIITLLSDYHESVVSKLNTPDLEFIGQVLDVDYGDNKETATSNIKSVAPFAEEPPEHGMASQQLQVLKDKIHLLQEEYTSNRTPQVSVDTSDKRKHDELEEDSRNDRFMIII